MWPWRKRAERSRADLGRYAENLAARHLRRQGYSILERNVRLGHLEIDIVARDGDTLAFVEVRSRVSGDPIPPEDTINDIKQRKLIAAAGWYLAKHKIEDTYCRFDVVAVTLPENEKPEILLIRDAFAPGH